jgi:hypothetical protein
MRLPNNWKLIGDLIFVAEIFLHIVRHFLTR